MKKLLTLAVIIVTISSTSCTKEAREEILANSNITVGFQIAGVPITLSLGGGSGMYYDRPAYDGYVYGSNYSSMTGCYVISKPGNGEAINVYDKFGRQIGTVRCDQGVGSQTGVLYDALRAWFDNHTTPCFVQVKWDPIPFTHGGMWSGTIVG
mgnify:CR=1 FL=1